MANQDVPRKGRGIDLPGHASFIFVIMLGHKQFCNFLPVLLKANKDLVIDFDRWNDMLSR